MRSSRANILHFEAHQHTCAICAEHKLCLPAKTNHSDLQQHDTCIKRSPLFSTGKLLFSHGDPFHALYIVHSGSLKTYSQTKEGSWQVLGFHLPGEIIGFDALNEGQYICTAETLEPTHVCTLTRTYLERLITEEPSIYYQLLCMLSREAAIINEHLVMMGKHQAQERLATFLVHLSDRCKHLHRDAESLTLSMTRYDIANYLGLAVETVSRLFTHLHDIGVLAVHRKHILIRDHVALRALCDESQMIPQPQGPNFASMA